MGIFTLLAYIGTFGFALLGLEDGDKFIRDNVFSDLSDLGTGNLIYSIIPALAVIMLGYIYSYLKKEKK